MQKVTAQQACIWLVGGTGESAQLANALSERGLPYVVTVTTEAARRLYPPTANVWVGRLTAQGISAFINQQAVRCVLDASHPFACDVSQLAIATAKAHTLDYLRYERPAVDIGSCTPSQSIEVDSVESLLSSDILNGQRVLFTVGYRHLGHFAHLRPSAHLFARILPSIDAITGAIAAGFSSADLVALRPPVSAAVEAALWQQWRITHVVAKASGAPGGEAIKRQVAAELGVTLILIQRPQLIYPNHTNSLLTALKFCSKVLSVY